MLLRRRQIPRAVVLLAVGLTVTTPVTSAVEPPQAPVTVITLAGAAPGSPLYGATGMEVGQDGALYIYEGQYGVIRKLSGGVLSIVAGSPLQRDHVNGTGAAARIAQGKRMVRGAGATLYFAERETATIRTVTPAGVVSTIAGTAYQHGTVDGPSGTARLSAPDTLVVDAAGVVYFATPDSIRRVALDGAVSTIFTSSSSGWFSSRPTDMALGATGDLFVVDYMLGMIHRITPAGGYSAFATLAVSPSSAIVHAGADRFYVSRACDLRLVDSTGVLSTVTVCSGASMAIADLAMDGQDVIALTTGLAPGLIRVSSDGTVTEIFTATNQPDTRDGTGAAARFVEPTAIAGLNGSMTVLNGMTLRPLTSSGTVSSQFGSAYVYRGAVRTTAGLYLASGCRILGPNVQVGGAANVIGPPGGAGCGSVDGTGTAARFLMPTGLAADSAGNIFVADTGNHTIRKVTPAEVVTTVAGLAGAAGHTDAAGTSARFNTPTGVAVDATGVLYVADSENHVIRRIATDGTVTTLAGLAGSAGSVDGAGTEARFNTPTGIAIDSQGVLLVADRWNHAVRAVTQAGVVTTVAGALGQSGSADGSGAAARFREPHGVYVDASDTVYVADTMNHTVRAVFRSEVSAPVITTHPQSVTGNEGATVTFTCQASGVPTPDYQWQRSTDQGQTFTNMFSQPTGGSLSVQGLTLSSQNYRYRCLAANPFGTATTTAATLTVQGLTASPVRLHFGAVKAGSAGAITSLTPAQTVSVSYVASTAPVWTATADQSWLQITGGNGTGAGTFTVGVVNPSNVIAGSTRLTGTITLTASNVGLQRTIPVVLTVTHNPASAAPIGNLDIPVNGATGLSGAIVVSGWALDDIGIDKVEIWRDLVPGESTPPYVGPGPGNGKVFIAHGLFGSGTRPDVELNYAHIYPLASRGGWGYMLLTYGLPDRGNGTYVIRAFAYDTEGQYTALGAKTITVNNNAATKPFGTLDYPEQSGTVSGNYTANGWVLTPNVNGVPACTFDHIVMELDSNQVYIPVTYGQSRPDVTAAFPGLSTSSAPGASAVFDSTTFTNGVHTIGWLAYDTCGRGEGIGSRFINISNTGGGDTAVRPTRDLRSAGLDAPMLPRQTVRVDVLERAELTLPTIEGATWTGREVVGGEARQLPIGSSLDSVTGRFAWRPVAGFFGAFDLRFVAHVGGAAVAQVPVRVIVGPGVRLVIDTPSSHEQVPGVFTIAGWVADLAAPDGTGIDAVHVWAYPLEGGGAPIFAGHAGLGAPRADVAEVHGAQFASSGYYLTVGHLPRGWYDIVVYPHSSVDGEFRGARVVRVLVR